METLIETEKVVIHISFFLKLNKDAFNFFLFKKSRYDHFYVLEIDLYDGNARKTRQTVHETSIAKYFDENGVLCTKPFYNDLLRFFTAIANAEEKKSK